MTRFTRPVEFDRSAPLALSGHRFRFHENLKCPQPSLKHAESSLSQHTHKHPVTQTSPLLAKNL